MNVNVQIIGLEELTDKLDRLGSLEQAISDACYELMEDAEDIVLRWYGMQGNGNTDYTTTVERVPGGATLIASGEDIGFLEFGAGVFTEADEFASQVGYPVQAWSWSDSHMHSTNPNARYGSKNGFWWYSGIRYTGLAPMRGMQHALDHIRNEVENKIRGKIEEWIGQ